MSPHLKHEWPAICLLMLKTAALSTPDHWDVHSTLPLWVPQFQQALALLGQHAYCLCIRLHGLLQDQVSLKQLQSALLILKTKTATLTITTETRWQVTPRHSTWYCLTVLNMMVRLQLFNLSSF